MRWLFVFLFSLVVTTQSLSSASIQTYEPTVQVVSDEDAMSYHTAQMIIHLIKKNNAAKKKTVLGLATGSTPVPVYKELQRQFAIDPNLDLSNVVTFNLDEYVGLPKEDPQSYHSFMYKNLFTKEMLYSPANPRGIKEENIYIPNASIDPTTYETLIKEQGPIDLQILGIGENGHIGFAEPGSPFEGRTAVVPLAESTRKANARFYEGELSKVPTHAITMGVGTILEAKEIILLAKGTKKSLAIRSTLKDHITEEVPASALRLHPKVTFILDVEAAKEI